MSHRIDPSRLKELREGQRLTLDALATRSHIARETIHRIEKGRLQRTRTLTLERLASALGVAEGVLTGQLEIPEDLAHKRDLVHESKSQFNVELSRAQHNAYVLVAQRYGIPMTRVAELAPLLFVLAAEQSLRWRKAVLDRFNAIVDQQSAMLGDFPHLPGSIAMRDEAIDALLGEEKSIFARDILATQLPDRLYKNFLPVKWRYDETADNPFVRYLHLIASDFSEIVDIESFSAYDLTDFTVCKDDLERLANGDKKLIDAVRFGIIQLSSMPRILYSDDKTQDRISWMQSQIEAFRQSPPADVPDVESL